jgi:hypothetical protein
VKLVLLRHELSRSVDDCVDATTWTARQDFDERADAMGLPVSTDELHRPAPRPQLRRDSQSCLEASPRPLSGASQRNDAYRKTLVGRLVTSITAWNLPNKNG